MDAVKYFKEKRRMLNAIGGCITSSCRDCPIGRDNNGIGVRCTVLQIEYPEEAVAIVEKWSQEHTRKTMLSDLLEKYPKTSLEKNGTPNFCPDDLGYCEEIYCDIQELDCGKCWNRPLEEGEK